MKVVELWTDWPPVCEGPLTSRGPASECDDGAVAEVELPERSGRVPLCAVCLYAACEKPTRPEERL